MNPTQAFGELRSVAHGEPGEQAWGRLVGVIASSYERWPAEVFIDQALPYLEHALERWPSEWREAPEEWVRAASRGYATPWLSLARVIRYQGSLSNKALRALHNSEWINRVQVLDLSHNRIKADGLIGFVRSPCAWSLQELDLSDNPLAWQGARELGQAASLSGLRALRLNKTRMTPRGARALLNQPAFRDLEELALDDNELHGEVLSLIAAAQLDKLERLSLADISLSEQLHGVLLTHPNLFEGLRVLNLRGARLAPSDLDALLGLARMPLLTEIDLSGALSYNMVGMEFVHRLASTPWFEQLHDLRLRDIDLAWTTRIELMRRVNVGTVLDIDEPYY
jgi:hypothetical protein